ncbi:MAG: hypothetical protein QOF78_3198, partial [Phycisphaerales bacterium]|nr:hypothetical protein [Phycisphaerales bacterium]
MMTSSPLHILSHVLAQTTARTQDAVGMPRFDRGMHEVVLYSVAPVFLIIAGYRHGRHVV